MSGKDIKLKKKLLKVENVVGENVKQAEIRSDVKFPVKVKKIWEVDADVRDIETKVIEDKVIVSGTIHKQIFFVADEDRRVGDVFFKKGEVFEKTVEEKFTEFVDVPGAMEDFDAQVEVRVEFVDLEVLRIKRQRVKIRTRIKTKTKIITIMTIMRIMTIITIMTIMTTMMMTGTATVIG